MNKQFFVVVIVIVAALVGIFAVTGKKDENSSTTSSASASEHIVGNKESKVKLVEYGDFQCPACKSYYPIIKQIKETYGDRISFQFRHFPLSQIHNHAVLGSRAAEAAGKQDKFFEMHDLLYQNQDTWSPSSNPTPIFEGYAQQLGLNMDQFKSDMSSAAVLDIINADMRAGQALGVNSTPTFVLNDKKIEKSPTSIDEFKKLIDDAIANNQ